MKNNNLKAGKAGSSKHLQAAWNFYRLGLLEDAESICQEVLQRYAKEAEALSLLGAIALHYGKAKEAAQTLSLAITYNQKNPETYSNLGLAYHEQGLLNDAIKSYRQAIVLNPGYVNAYYNLHAALLNSADPKPALVLLRKLIEIHPNDKDAVFMAAILAKYAGEVKESERYISLINQQAPLYQARMDAWDYLNGSSKSRLPIMGSGITVFEYAMSVAPKDGLVLEFGVRFGTSIRMIASMAEEVHGFDSFEGLPDEWHHEPKGSYTTKGLVPEVPVNVTLHVGWFENTLPTFLAEHAGPVRFINVDCDIYSSTKTVLELLAPRIVIGSVIVFDEYIGNEHWREDEFKAFQETVSKYGWQYEYLCFSFFTKQVAVKITRISP